MNTRLLDCGHPPSNGNGLAIQPNGRKICHECAAEYERQTMIDEGAYTLYLVDAHASIGGWAIQNFPGTLTFKVTRIRKSPRGGGFGSDRFDAWFTGPDGKPWHAINRGDNQIARCKRVKS